MKTRAVLAALVVASALAAGCSSSSKKTYVRVPRVWGSSLSSAETKIKAAGFKTATFDMGVTLADYAGQRQVVGSDWEVVGTNPRGDSAALEGTKVLVGVLRPAEVRGTTRLLMEDQRGLLVPKP